MRLAVLISGGGTNLAALIEAQKERYFESTIEAVVSNRADAYGLERAKQAGIETFVTKEESELMEVLEKKRIDLIVLAGYLRILSKELIEHYENRIINIHPSLLPAYGGKGMYGLYVHEAVWRAKEPRTGATVHYVTQEVDRGAILLQEDMAIDYHTLSSPQELQRQVLGIEHRILKEAIRISEGKI